jgi:hypothetical protein
MHESIFLMRLMYHADVASEKGKTTLNISNMTTAPMIEMFAGATPDNRPSAVLFRGDSWWETSALSPVVSRRLTDASGESAINGFGMHFCERQAASRQLETDAPLGHAEAALRADESFAAQFTPTKTQ